MKKLFLLIATLSAIWQTALSQPTGPEILWFMYAGSNCAQFTSDDKYIVADNAPEPTDSLIIIEVTTGKVLRQCFVPNIRRAIRLSNNDSLIYSCGDGANIFVHKFGNLEQIKRIDQVYKKYWDIDGYKSADMAHFDLSKDNNLIVANYSNRAICLYDIKKDSVVQFEPLQDKFNFSKVKFFDNDNKLAVAYSSVINIYDVKTWKVINTIGTFEGHTQYIQDFDISPEESRIVTCANDGKIIVWDLMTGEKNNEIDLPDIDLRHVKFLLTNEQVMYGGGIPNKTTIINLKSKQLIYRNNTIASGRGIEFSHNKKLILSIEGSRYVLIDFNLASVTEGKENNSQILFPNPVDWKLNVSLFLSYPSMLNYEMVNSSGALIKKETLGNYDQGKQNISINVSNLQNGTYFLRINTIKETFTYKFMIGR